MNNITERPHSLLLAMASSPAETFPTQRFYGSRFQFSGYKLLRFAQKTTAILIILGLSTGLFFTIRNFFVRSVRISGVSMVPTLAENGNYLLNLWAFHNREPQHNDIVVIRDPGDHGLSVKRVIAMPGDTIHFKRGNVYVNGIEIDEPYVLGHTHTFTYSKNHEQMITCGKDEYFVMGDNRVRSIDSRSYGPVTRADVLGLLVH